VTALGALAGALLLGGLAFRGPANAGAGPAPPADRAAPRAEAPRPAQEAAALPAPVTVSRPVRREFTPFEDFTGRLEALPQYWVLARVSGRVRKSHVKDGDKVKRGDLLIEIDDRPYRAAVTRAEAEAAAVAEQRRQADAALRRAREDSKAAAAKQEELPRLVAAAAGAEEDDRRARLALEHARRDLEATRVVSPVAGEVEGALNADDDLAASWLRPKSAVALRNIVSAMRVKFHVDERSFLRYRRMQTAAEAPRYGAPLSLRLADEVGFPHRAFFDHFEDRIDEKTGTVGAYAIIPEPSDVMLPGMFARVRMPFGKPRQVLMVPDSAVGSDQGKRFVYVINDANVAERRYVKFGGVVGDLNVIEDGLGSDEWVVTAGMQGVTPGAKVDPHRAPEPGVKPPAKE
jgi:RND family efflux transporter MFP subunit